MLCSVYFFDQMLKIVVFGFSDDDGSPANV